MKRYTSQIRVKMKGFVFHISIFIASFIIFLIYALGALRYVSTLTENTCELTYMFEYPQYVRIELDDEIQRRHPKYALYAYGEGFVTDKLRKMQFTGIPVLFIPGNAGSHEQVRSLASVSLRLALKRRTAYHFDYFAVSLAEGYSALYGGVLEDQTAFVAESIQKILPLYKKKTAKVVLIGHSMGGIVAKAVLLNNSSNTLASLLITLAAPHAPRIAFDKTTCDFYNKVNARAMDLKNLNTSVISIGGGSRDVMVTTSQIWDPHADLNVIGNAIPDCWKALDHLSILWCKQFVIPLIRALFDSVDYSEGHHIVSDDQQKRISVFKYHLANRFSGKYFTQYNDRVTFSSPGDWIEISKEQYTFQESLAKAKTKSDSVQTYLMIPIPKRFTHISIDALDLKARDWIFVCSAVFRDEKKNCEWGWNLTNRTRIIPTFKEDLKRSIDLDLSSLRSNEELTHILVRIPKKTSDPSTVHFDLYSLGDISNNNASDAREIVMPDTHSSWIPRGLSILFPGYKTINMELKAGHIRHYIRLDGINDVAFVKLKEINGGTSDDKKLAYAVVELVEEYDHSDSTVFNQIRVVSINELRRKIPFRIQSSAPANLIITSSPKFSYDLEISQGGIVDRMGMYVRDRWDRLYLVLMSLCLLIISTRMQERSSINVPYAVTILGLIYLDLAVEFMVSLGVLHVLALSTCSTVVFSGSVVHNFAAKFLSRAITLFPASWYNWLLKEGTYEHLPILSSLLVISLVSASCGAIAMALSVIIYLLKLTHMYDEYLEELVMSSLRVVTNKFDKFLKKRDRNNKQDANVDPRTNILNHLILFVTWTLTSLAAVPSVLVWAKNFSYETRLSTEDPIMFWSWIIITGWGSLGLVAIPKQHPNKYINVIGVYIQRILSWLLLLSAGSKNPAFYQWMISPVFAISITSIVLLSLLSRFRKAEENSVDQIVDSNEKLAVNSKKVTDPNLQISSAEDSDMKKSALSFF